MTIYNSQRVNNDPFPYQLPDGSRDGNPLQYEFKEGRIGGKRNFGAVYNPRPEYDNNPNPLLEASRKHGPGLFGGTEGWLQYAMHGTHVDRVPFTEAHLEHAHRVLTKLINVYKGTA